MIQGEEAEDEADDGGLKKCQDGERAEGKEEEGVMDDSNSKERQIPEKQYWEAKKIGLMRRKTVYIHR